MYFECLEVMTDAGTKGIWNVGKANYGKAVKRMQRFGMILERFISPEGSFPVFGRSITYRTGTLQPLALLSWRQMLPEELSDGQVRAAMTAVVYGFACFPAVGPACRPSVLDGCPAKLDIEKGMGRRGLPQRSCLS